MHLFDVQPAAAKVVQPKVINAPKTQMKLKLTGLVSASSTEFGYAMIEVKRCETSVVGVGQKIGKTSAKLHAIQGGHILIDYRGKIEKLQLEREILGFADTNALSTETIKQLNLSVVELATLTQIVGRDAKADDENFLEAEQVQ